MAEPDAHCRTYVAADLHADRAGNLSPTCIYYSKTQVFPVHHVQGSRSVYLWGRKVTEYDVAIGSARTRVYRDQDRWFVLTKRSRLPAVPPPRADWDIGEGAGL